MHLATAVTPWALLSEILLLFGSHMSGGGQNQIGKAFTVLIKLRIWQLASCCRGWRTMSPSVGTSYPRLKASTVAFLGRFPPAGLHAAAAHQQVLGATGFATAASCQAPGSRLPLLPPSLLKV